MNVPSVPAWRLLPECKVFAVRLALLLQVALLSPIAATNDALHAQLSNLRKDLQQAQASAALLPPETARAEEAQANCRRLEAEAASTSGQMSRLQEQLHSTEQKLQEAQGTPACLLE